MNNNRTPSQIHLSLDVEADGPCPGLFSMLSFGLVPLHDLQNGFYSTVRPISERFDTAAMGVGGFTREQALSFDDAGMVMKRMKAWLDGLGGTGRVVVWSDNPAFDWQFLNYYCHAYLEGNPFGHSARRIGDLYAGWRKDPRQTKDWRKWRGEPHTHNALDDARGNARALVALMDRIRGGVPNKS